MISDQGGGGAGSAPDHAEHASRRRHTPTCLSPQSPAQGSGLQAFSHPNKRECFPRSNHPSWVPRSITRTTPHQNALIPSPERRMRSLSRVRLCQVPQPTNRAAMEDMAIPLIVPALVPTRLLATNPLAIAILPLLPSRHQMHRGHCRKHTRELPLPNGPD